MYTNGGKLVIIVYFFILDIIIRSFKSTCEGEKLQDKQVAHGVLTFPFMLDSNFKQKPP
jgi:hypothetical protein